MNKELVYVGGVVTGLLITDPAAPEIRITKDVDCIVEVATRADYDTRIRSKLTERGFVEMRGDGIPVCAWTADGLRVDVMPTNDSLGFSNRWYSGALETATLVDLGDVSIRVISPSYFLATKLEAFESRGRGDFLSSHDLEDIVAVVDGRTEIATDVKHSDRRVKDYLTTRLRDLLQTEDFRAALPGHVVDATRTSVVLERIRTIADA
jgi:hypothetical protein